MRGYQITDGGVLEQDTPPEDVAEAVEAFDRAIRFSRTKPLYELPDWKLGREVDPEALTDQVAGLLKKIKGRGPRPLYTIPDWDFTKPQPKAVESLQPWCLWSTTLSTRD